MASVEHRAHKGLNDRAENSHQPTGQRERAMKYFRSPGAAQRFRPRSAASHPTSDPAATSSQPAATAPK
jgi:putative transposase